MNEERAIEFLENSFLRKYLFDPNVTDISYNGENLFYQDNQIGRIKIDVDIDVNDVMNFLRQIANLGEKKFSIQDPVLDLTIGKYRLNAVHPFIGRKKHKKVPTFSVRISSDVLRIENDKNFLPNKAQKLIEELLNKKISIVIGGATGSGKTELQKYLLSLMQDSTRVIVIDNVLELDSVAIKNDIDLTTWQYDDRKKDMSINFLVRNALRSNPDWLIVAESRGAEMLDVLNSSMTGHPIITTIHAQNINSMLTRIASMVMMADKRPSLKDVKFDVFTHLQTFVFTKKKEVFGTVCRYVSHIMLLGPQNKSSIVYQSDGINSTYSEIDEDISKNLGLDEKFIKEWKQ